MNSMITSGPSVQALSTRQRSLVHNVIVSINTYPLDNDLSGRKHYPTFQQPEKWNVFPIHKANKEKLVTQILTLSKLFNM